MQRKVSAKPVLLAGRNKSEREFIYLHMSNHYKRIFNAKKAIDNSPPTCFKGKRPSTSNPGIAKNKVNRHFESLILTDRSLSTNSNRDSWGADSFTCGSRYHARCVPDTSSNMTSPKLGDIDLIERITYDTKHGPSAYSEKSWTKPKEHAVEKRLAVKENKSEVKHAAGKRSLSNAGHSERTQKRKLNCQKVLKPSQVPAKGNKSIPSVKGKLSSKVLKTTVVSKLRSLRVYHPPRRVESRPKTENSRTYCKCTKICLCDESGCVNESASKKMTLNPKDHSVTSSRDSAYNGGISSVPESRSPTPDQKSKKDCCCCCCERMQRASMLFPKERSNTTTPRATTPRATTPRATTPRVTTPRATTPRATTPRAMSPRVTSPGVSSPRSRSPNGISPRSRSPKARSISPKSTGRPKSEISSSVEPKSGNAPNSGKVSSTCSETSTDNSGCKSESPEADTYEKMQDDALYVAFVQDITTEVLEKNLYTNRALKNVMRKHLQKNMKKLNKDRMLQELENLRLQLGIPEDHSLFDSAIDATDSICDLSKSTYPVISDSEFSLPVEDSIPLERETTPEIIKPPEKVKPPEKMKPPEKTKPPEKMKPPEKLKTPERPKPQEKSRMPEKAKTMEKAKPVDKAKATEKAKPPEKVRIVEKGKPPEKPKQKPTEEPKPPEETTTCIFIKSSADSAIMQAARIKAATEPSYCLQLKPSYRSQFCGQTTTCCYLPLSQSSGPSTSCFLPLSQSSGPSSPCFLQQPSTPTKTSFIQHESSMPTKTSFSQQSSTPTKISFIPQPSTPTKTALVVRPSTPTKNSFTQQSSTPTKISFIPRPSTPTKTSHIPQPSTPTKSALVVRPSTPTRTSFTTSQQSSYPAHQPGQLKRTPDPALPMLTAHSYQPSSTQTNQASQESISMETASSRHTGNPLLPASAIQAQGFMRTPPPTQQAPLQEPRRPKERRHSRSTEVFRKKSEKITSTFERSKNSSETDNEFSGIPKKKSPRERRKEESMMKNNATRSREMSSEDSDRPSEPKKRSYGKSRRQKLLKRYTFSSSDSELSGCYSKTLLKENRKVSISKDTYSAGSSTPTHVRKKSRSVSFWRNPEYKSYRGPKIKTRKTVVSHSEESFVIGRKKSPKCE